MNQLLNKTNAAKDINSVINDAYGEMPSHRFVHTFGFEHRHNINGKKVNFDDLKQKISDKLGVPVKSYKAVMYAETSNGHVYVHHAAGTVKDGFLSIQTFKPSGYENELPPFKNSRRDSIVEAYLNQSGEHPMIEVDGVMRHRHNSLGQPIHHTDEGIRNFHRWFRDSKAVDKHGRPKVFYHGTGADIEEFDNTKAPSGLDKNREGVQWFSSAPEVAGGFAGSQRGETIFGMKLGHSNILPVYLKVSNPHVDMWGKYARYGGIKRSEINELDDHDGIHFPQADVDLPDTTEQGPVRGYYRNRHGEAWGESEEGYPDQWAVFNPNQIKSAIGNNGNFSSSNKITESIDPIAKAYIQLKEESELPSHLLDSITSSGRYSINRVSPLSYGNGYEVYYSTNKPDSAVSYDRYKNPRRNKGESWYNPKYATLQKQNEGESFESQSPVLKPEYSSSIKTNPDSNLLYRGISAEEFESIKNTGKIRSRGDYNLEGQEGLTYFSTDPSAAQHYAHSFAPLHFKATHDKPAYVIGVRNPGTGVKIAGTGEHEVGIPHEIDASEIQEIHRGIPYSADSGSQEYMKEWGDKEFKPTSSSAPSTHLVWERIK